MLRGKSFPQGFHPVYVAVLSGENGSPAGGANRIGDQTVFQYTALFSQFPDVWCMYIILQNPPIDSPGLSRMIVRQNKKYIRPDFRDVFFPTTSMYKDE
jgi:hypothetical protein